MGTIADALREKGITMGKGINDPEAGKGLREQIQLREALAKRRNKIADTWLLLKDKIQDTGDDPGPKWNVIRTLAFELPKDIQFVRSNGAVDSSYRISPDKLTFLKRDMVAKGKYEWKDRGVRIYPEFITDNEFIQRDADYQVSLVNWEALGRELNIASVGGDYRKLLDYAALAQQIIDIWFTARDTRNSEFIEHFSPASPKK